MLVMLCSSHCSAGTDDDEFAAESASYQPKDEFDVDMSVVKSKQFPMTPCTVKDAVLALDYIDHPFYVFRNSATKEVSTITNC
jgi:putative sigma-54 modulation protein